MQVPPQQMPLYVSICPSPLLCMVLTHLFYLGGGVHGSWVIAFWWNLKAERFSNCDRDLEALGVEKRMGPLRCKALPWLTQSNHSGVRQNKRFQLKCRSHVGSRWPGTPKSWVFSAGLCFKQNLASRAAMHPAKPERPQEPTLLICSWA